jgi:Glycosyl hydrolase 108/Predicted Peptidoglycan domain
MFGEAGGRQMSATQSVQDGPAGSANIVPAPKAAAGAGEVNDAFAASLGPDRIFSRNGLVEATPSIISILLVLGCLAFGARLMLGAPISKESDPSSLIHVALGTMVSILSTVVHYWLGSRSTPTAAERLTASQQASQAASVARLTNTVRDNAQQNNALVQSLTAPHIAAAEARPPASSPAAIAAAPAPAPARMAAPAVPPAAAPANTDALFGSCMAVVLREEGGFVDNPADPGGATNMGITLRTLAAWRHAPTSVEDVRNLSVDEAERIYRAHYWNAMSCDSLPAGVDLMVFDFGVNAGPEEAIRTLQRAVGVTADGRMGPATLGAVARMNPADLTARLAEERLNFYRGLSTFSTFGAGWTRRVDEVKADALKMIG